MTDHPTLVQTEQAMRAHVESLGLDFEAAHAVSAAISQTIVTRFVARPRPASVAHSLRQRHLQLAMTA